MSEFCGTDAGDSLPNQKRAMRAQVIATRDALNAEMRRRKSAEVCARLTQLLFAQDEAATKASPRLANTPCAAASNVVDCNKPMWSNESLATSAERVVAVYASMGSEVCLDDFIANAYDAGRTVAFPCMNQKGCSPRMCMRIVSREAWSAGCVPFINAPLRRFAEEATEVSAFPVADPRSITFVATPLVAFDDEGFRLGYGGGNYDEYLTLLSEEAYMAGVAFSEQRVHAVPREPHDRKLDAIVFA